MVPSGTSTYTSSPFFPNISLAPPLAPALAANLRWRRKLISVFRLPSARIITDPPLPPSPPLGPPRGTYFSRRKETMPSPPAPETTIIFALSINISIPHSKNDRLLHCYYIMPGKNIKKRSFISCTSYFMGKKKTAVLPEKH